MENNLGKYKLVLGLEIHIQPKTAKKMFCGCDFYKLGMEPNTNTCPTCLGLPGALPVPNFEAVKKTQMLGLALNCKLNANSKFDRKHYFYPDLPKGYQISQYEEPLCGEGEITLENGVKALLERIHLEEDTAKSFHKDNKTLIDYNMSSMPLMELVTKPCFTSAKDAADFARKVREVVRFLEISDCDMEKGQMRIEPNISLRTAEMEAAGELPNYKVEVKNINSFKFMENAVNYEIKRQRKILESGKTPMQENRGYDSTTKTTKGQRSKEDAQDYRYFPEPDIPPMVFDDQYFEELKINMPELPGQAKNRLISEYGIKEQDAEELTKGENKDLLQKFEQICATNFDPEKAANLLLNKKEYRDLDVLDFVKKAKEADNKITDLDELEKYALEAVKENPKALEEYKSGKDTVIQFFIGQIMRKTRGKADSGVAAAVIKKVLSEV